MKQWIRIEDKEWVCEDDLNLLSVFLADDDSDDDVSFDDDDVSVLQFLIPIKLKLTAYCQLNPRGLRLRFVLWQGMFLVSLYPTAVLLIAHKSHDDNDALTSFVQERKRIYWDA